MKNEKYNQNTFDYNNRMNDKYWFRSRWEITNCMEKQL